MFRIFILIFILTFKNVSMDPTSSSFCLCALRELLEDYAMFAVQEDPPRYRSIFPNDIGFYVGTTSNWKEVNNATWIDLSMMIREPRGMYTRISLDGIHPINNGLPLNSARSAYLGEILTAYHSMIKYIDSFHERVIESRAKSCSLNNQRKSNGKISKTDYWQNFF